MIASTSTVKWPPYPSSDFLVDRDEQQEISQFVHLVLQTPNSTSWNVRKWSLTRGRVADNPPILLGGREWRLPITLYFHYNSSGKIVDVFLLLNSKRGADRYEKGGERKPKPAYSLLKGYLCCKKRCSPHELVVIERLVGKKEAGLSQIFAIRRDVEKNKVSYFEEHFDRLSIHRLIGSSFLCGDRMKIWVTLQLLLGLDVLHKQGIVHEDISAGNIVMRSNYDAALIDFGCFNNPLAGVFSFFSPDRMALMWSQARRENPQELSRLRFEDDYWALGLVIATFTINTFAREFPGKSVAPLDFLINNYSPYTRFEFLPIRTLTTDVIRKELHRFKEFCAIHKKQPEIYQVLWEVVEELLCPTLDHSILLETLIRKVSDLRCSANPLARLVRKLESIDKGAEIPITSTESLRQDLKRRINYLERVNEVLGKHIQEQNAKQEQQRV